MLTIIIFLPLIAAGICGTGRLLGVNGVKIISPMIMALTVITSAVLFLKTNISGKIYTFNLGC
jgi:NADH:ubiquinone oxidoreductase subunit 4 (subunit M)